MLILGFPHGSVGITVPTILKPSLRGARVQLLTTAGLSFTDQRLRQNHPWAERPSTLKVRGICR